MGTEDQFRQDRPFIEDLFTSPAKIHYNYSTMDMDDVWKDLFSAVKEEEWDEAIVSVDNLIKKNPSDPEHFAKLGDLYAKEKKNSEALAAYREAVRLYKEAKAHGKAMLICKNILALDPANADALSELQSLLCMPDSDRATLPMRKRAAAVPAKEDKKIHIRIDASRLDDGAEAVAEQVMTLQDFLVSEKSPPFLKDLLEDESLTRIYDLHPVKFSPGDEIIREGESGNSVFVIVKGNVEVSSTIQGKMVELAELGEGDMFGEMAFLTSKPRTATVTAIADVEVLELTKKLLDVLIESRPHILKYFYSMYTSRVDITMSKLKETGGDKLSGNLQDLALPDLLQIFDQSKKEGVLFISSAAGSGRISFRDGLVMDASFEDSTGEDALVELLALKQGNFTYEPREVTTQKIAKPITFVLMECIRLIDEKLLMKNYIPGTDNKLTLSKVPAFNDSEMKAVVDAMQKGAQKLAEIQKASGMSCIRIQLVLAKLAKDGILKG